jgi:hypothetical protein
MTARRSRCLLAATLLATQALANTSPEGFDAQLRAAQRGLGLEAMAFSAGRARYMACGFVAPSLSRPEPPASVGDEAYAQMLERLRAYLRRFGEMP